MKVPTIVAVMVLGAASMWAQAPAATAAPAAQTAAAPATSKPAGHESCMRGKMAHTGMKKGCHCMRNKDGKMSKEMDGTKHGSCPRMKAENKS